MSITVTPISDALGAEIGGVDISRPLSQRDIADVTDAWHEYILLLFRDHDLDDDSQLAFARQFGAVGERSRPAERRPEGADYNAAIMLITNIRENGRPIGSLPGGEMWFHHDMCYAEAPHKGTFLYGIQIPAVGGHTKFANMYKAYDRLPPATKAKIKGRKALQIYDFGTAEQVAIESDEDIAKYQHYWQPVAVTHPVTGRKALYVNPLITARIEGMGKDESDALLEELFAFADCDELIYEHHWQPRDLVMWDNWCSCHARTDFPETETRLMRRCTILGQALQE